MLVGHEYVVVEEAFFDNALGKHHFSIAVLDSFHPFSCVGAAVSPFHFTLTVALVVLVVAAILVTASPFENTVAVLFVLHVGSFVGVRVLSLALSPFPVAMLQAILKLSNVRRPIVPYVLPIPVRLAVSVVSYVHISVSEHICAAAMLEATFPLPLVAISVLP